MKIKRMTATFGCLAHETLELEDGLNILTLPNEGGKSTWCAFLRVMLYGLNTRERDKKGFLADKSHYLPWSGGAMEGEMLCSWQGRDILIRRYTKGSTPMGGFEATYADTGEAVPGLTGDNLGDILIGVSRSVFERSAFLKQASLPVSQTPELEKRLSAIVSSGEEGVAATQVRQTLTDWQRKRRYRTRGTIPTLEARRSELNTTLDAIRDMTGKIRTDQTELDRLEELRARLQHQVELHRAQSESAQAQAYAQAERELTQAKSQLERLQSQLPQQGELPPREILEQARDQVAQLRQVDNSLKQAAHQIPPAEEALAQAQAATEDPVFSGDAAQARGKVQEAQRRYDALERARRQASRCAWMLPVLFLLIAAAICCGFLVASGHLTWYAGAAALAALIVGGVLGGVFVCRKKRRGGEMQAILDAFHVADGQALSSAAEPYCARLDALRRAEEELARVKKAEEAQQTERDRLWNGLHDLVTAFAPEVKDVFGFSAAITRGLTLLDAIAGAEQKQESAQRLFDTVSAHGKGCAGALLEQPSITAEQADAGVKEADRRIADRQSDLSMARGRRSALGEEEALQAELDAIDRDLERYNADYDAIGIALEVLEQADAEMRERFSPELNRQASAYLSRLTAGKYDRLRLNRELEAGVQETGGVAPRDALVLSQGTADQLWLAVRLAVCDLALPQEEPCPLVLDDALVNLDDSRILPALALLQELAGQRQILLFTCHGREAQLYREHILAATGKGDA